MQYKRNIEDKIFNNRLIIALLLIGSYFIITTKNYSYFFFIVVIYLVSDFIFATYCIEIDNAFIVITRYFIGGIFKRKIVFNKNKVIGFRNIDTETRESMTNPEHGTGIVSDSSSKKYELYRIIYLDNQDRKKKIKIFLLQEEMNILSKSILV